MKKTLSILALTAAIGLGAVHVAHAADAPPPGDHGPGGPGHGGFFKDADTNNDGFLTREEMESKQKERLDGMFAKTDTDHDGKLSQDELKKGREEMRAKMKERFKDKRDAAKGAE